MIAAPHHVVMVEEYHRMIAAGVFAPGKRVELLDGELLAMAPMGDRHYHAAMTLCRQFIRALGDEWAVGVQGPLTLGAQDEPEPDLVIARPTGRKPRASEVLAVVEVADSTLDFDRGIKRPRYARAGIPTSWLVDLTTDRIEVSSGPSGDRYQYERIVLPDDTLLVPGSDRALDLPAVFARHRG